jgi:hypothetical protein
VFVYWARLSNGQAGADGKRVFTFDNGPIQETMGDLPLTEPDILEYLRSSLESGIAGVADAVADANAEKERINHGRLTVGIS